MAWFMWVGAARTKKGNPAEMEKGTLVEEDENY